IMKSRIYYLATFVVLLIVSGCSKRFLEEMKSYDKYDESVFTNEVQTNWYIDRLYNYYFVSQRNPLHSIVGSHNDSRSRMTEEIGGTVSNYINPDRTLELASEAD